MTLPSSGPLSIGNIKGEFGGPTSPSLGDYYAGGSYVPSGTSGTYGAVPSSGPISIKNFYGTSKFIPFTQTFTGGQSGSVTVPNGSVNLEIFMVSGGGFGGGASFNIPSGDYAGGGGGGSGGFDHENISTVGAGGSTINYAVGQCGHNVSGANGTATAVSGWLSRNVTGGTKGVTGFYPTFGTGGPGGSPGGNSGTTPSSFNTGGIGGASPYSGYGQGSDGASTGSVPGNDTDGVLVFKWT